MKYNISISQIKKLEKFTLLSIFTFILGVPFIIEVFKGAMFIEIVSIISLFFLFITPIFSFVGIFRSAIKEKRETFLSLTIFILSLILVINFVYKSIGIALVFGGI